MTPLEKHTVNVPNISCGHCVNAIKNELSELPGVSSVEGDPAAKTITVSFQAPATLDNIKATLKEINYPAEQ
jgi:copper chaperone